MGHSRKGYVFGDYWVYETDTALFKDPESFRQLLQQYNQGESLTIYHKVNEWSLIVRDKDFPLIPWQVDRNSGLQIPWKKIQGMKFRRLLIKDHYYNFLLSDLHPTDSSWSKDFILLDTPVGEDVECRLYICGKELNAYSKRLIADLAIMYST